MISLAPGRTFALPHHSVVMFRMLDRSFFARYSIQSWATQSTHMASCSVTTSTGAAPPDGHDVAAGAAGAGATTCTTGTAATPSTSGSSNS